MESCATCRWIDSDKCYECLAKSGETGELEFYEANGEGDGV